MILDPPLLSLNYILGSSWILAFLENHICPSVSRILVVVLLLLSVRAEREKQLSQEASLPPSIIL